MKFKKILSILLAVFIIATGSGIPTAIASAETYGNYTYKILNGNFCEITAYDGNEADISIPAEMCGYIVQNITSGVFKNNTYLETVVLPYTLEAVGSETFYGCTSLKSVEFTSSDEYGSKLTYISASMFKNCTSLKEITLPAGIVTIGESAFEGCSKIESVDFPNTLRTVGRLAFKNCSSYVNVNLPEGLTHINAYAFENGQFEEINIPDSVTTLSADAFFNCKKLSKLGYPMNWIETANTVDDFGTYNRTYRSPFYGCTALKEVIIDEGVTAIPQNAFRGQNGIEEINLPESLTYISPFAFYDCVTLKSLELPGGITQIPEQTFRNCTALETVEFNEGLQTIGSYAFYNCKALSVFEAPSTLINVNQYAFAECLGLRVLYLNDGLQTLAAYAFAGCDGLISIILNDDLTTLSNETFTDCANLTAAEIPNSVTSYGVNCFYNCPKLTIYCYTDSSAHLALKGSNYTYYLLDGHEHTYESYIETTATCFRKGAEIFTCSDCGYNYISLLERLGHSYEESTVEADCTNHGCTLYTCSVCGDFYEEDIVEAIGHIRDNWVTDIEPTFEADGHMNEICTACGETISEKSILKLISGDANRDGVVDAVDLGKLRKLLIGIDAATEYQTYVSDLNEDGFVNIRDLMRLKKGLAS